MRFTDMFNCDDGKLGEVIEQHLLTIDDAYVECVVKVWDKELNQNWSKKSKKELLTMNPLYIRVCDAALRIYSGTEDETKKFRVATLVQLFTRRYYLALLELENRDVIKSAKKEAFERWDNFGLAATISEWWVGVIETVEDNRSQLHLIWRR